MSHKPSSATAPPLYTPGVHDTRKDPRYHVIPSTPSTVVLGYDRPYYDRPEHATVVVVTQPVRELNLMTGPRHPIRLVCPSCRTNVRTDVHYSSDAKTHLCAFFLCLFVCWPCCLVPYCSKSCRNANHHCTNCGAYIATAI